MGLVLIVTMLIIGSFAIWQHPHVQKVLLRQYLGRMIVSGINHHSKPAAAKWGVDMQATNLYPQIIVTMKFRDYNGDTGVGAAQLQHQSCAVLEFFQNLKQSTRSKIYGLLIEDRVSFQIDVFNGFDQKIQSANQIMAECPNFPYA
ncbi:hypothetical protein [Acinetobacter higginsii]|uniref:hypothetical protein n=1 Tax=Acinetobacter higginsii TaxID=70347 RepID=UPI001F62472A|nr:hypothetical protein [Acinetobacter higginsii]MCI3879830.1 hypothetical protein [Acinetobacter higginsii]